MRGIQVITDNLVFGTARVFQSVSQIKLGNIASLLEMWVKCNNKTTFIDLNEHFLNLGNIEEDALKVNVLFAIYMLFNIE